MTVLEQRDADEGAGVQPLQGGQVVAGAIILAHILDDHGLAAPEVFDIAAVVAEIQGTPQAAGAREGPVAIHGDGLGLGVHQTIAHPMGIQEGAQGGAGEFGHRLDVVQLAEAFTQLCQGAAIALFVAGGLGGLLAFGDIQEQHQEALRAGLVRMTFVPAPVGLELPHVAERLAGIHHSGEILHPEVFEFGKQGAGGLADRLLRAQAEVRAPGSVDLVIAPVAAATLLITQNGAEDEALVQLLEQTAPIALAFRQFLLHLAHVALAVTQGLAGQMLGRTVAQDLDEAGMAAGVVVQRMHLAAGPEAGAVASQVPAFVFGATVLQRQPHFQRGPADLVVFGGEEALDRCAANLCGGPAQQAFGAAVPVGDHPGRIEHDHGEIDGTIKDRQTPLGVLGRQRGALVERGAEATDFGLEFSVGESGFSHGVVRTRGQRKRTAVTSGESLRVRESGDG